jgi:hypothetical protein
MTTITKQLSSGDGSLTLPLQYLEPFSYLEKTVDYFVHPQLLSEAVLQGDPSLRFLGVLKWYLANFYVTPPVLRKPYNPILGERFRTLFVIDRERNSKAHLVAEQVSHHPPLSVFHCSNRKDSWAVAGALLTKASFSGMSMTTAVDGTAAVVFPSHQECYEFAFPSVCARGLVIPPVTVELFGSFDFRCARTGLEANVEFKLKPKFGGEVNQVSVKVKKGKEQVYTITGRFDRTLTLRNAKTKEETVFWEVKENVPPLPRPERFDVPRDAQCPLDSELLWKEMTDHLINGEAELAFAAKKALEEKQREEEKERKEKKVDWVPSLFVAFDKEDDDSVWQAFATNTADLIAKRLPEDARKALLDKKGNCWWKYIHYDPSPLLQSEEEVEYDFVLKTAPLGKTQKDLLQPNNLAIKSSEPRRHRKQKSESLSTELIKGKSVSRRSALSSGTNEFLEKLTAIAIHSDQTSVRILEEIRMHNRTMHHLMGLILAAFLFQMLLFYFKK